MTKNFAQLVEQMRIGQLSSTIKQFDRHIKQLPINDPKRVKLACKMAPYIEQYAIKMGQLPE